MKKLNNKGITLVELLAVVVILAVVMGIAMTSVITAMNNSRKGSLQDSAISVERAFSTKYSESLVSGGVSSIYSEKDVKYDFSTASKGTGAKFYVLHENLSDELNLSKSSYVLGSKPNKTGDAIPSATEIASLTAINTSFVAFDGEKTVVCLVANKNGNYHVANAVGVSAGTNILGNSVTFAADVMWACSTDNTASWIANAA